MDCFRVQIAVPGWSDECTDGALIEGSQQSWPGSTVLKSFVQAATSKPFPLEQETALLGSQQDEGVASHRLKGKDEKLKAV